jgi:hypothetical protein
MRGHSSSSEDLIPLIPVLSCGIREGPASVFYTEAMRAWAGLEVWTRLRTCGPPAWLPPDMRMQASLLVEAARDAWCRVWLGACCRIPPPVSFDAAQDLGDWCRLQRRGLMLVPELREPFCSLAGRLISDETVLTAALPLFGSESLRGWPELVMRLEFNARVDPFFLPSESSQVCSDLVRDAWRLLRLLPGRCQPVMPPLPVNADGAAAALDQVVLWCDLQGPQGPLGDGEQRGHDRGGSGRWGALCGGQASDEPCSQRGTPDKGADFVQRALAVIFSHREWPQARYWAELGVSRATWFRQVKRNPLLKAALEARKGSPADLPRGYKDSEGNFDAFSDAR